MFRERVDTLTYKVDVSQFTKVNPSRLRITKLSVDTPLLIRNKYAPSAYLDNDNVSTLLKGTCMIRVDRSRDLFYQGRGMLLSPILYDERVASLDPDEKEFYESTDISLYLPERFNDSEQSAVSFIVNLLTTLNLDNIYCRKNGELYTVNINTEVEEYVDYQKRRSGGSN